MIMLEIKIKHKKVYVNYIQKCLWWGSGISAIRQGQRLFVIREQQKYMCMFIYMCVYVYMMYTYYVL